MTLPRVVMCSMWRNDISRHLVDRVEHLLAKSESYPALRWVWVVSGSEDDTLGVLKALSVGYDVEIVEVNTGIEGEDAPERLRRLSQTANVYFEHVRPSDEYILICESDISSPYDLVGRMVAHAQVGHCPIAGWPMLEIRPDTEIFYDVLMYRKDGQRFTHNPPYHACYRSNEIFEVDSAGTMLMLHAEDSLLIRMTDGGFLDLCRQLREQGRTIYVDPTLKVVHPYSLWVPRDVREYA